jgi:hypothetical protein
MITLPCLPCPHGSACCAYGVELVGDEADRIVKRFGAQAVVIGKDGGPRTRVDEAGCCFLSGNRCIIHDQLEYPAVCRGFPHHDALDPSLPYQADVSICPEMR